MPEPASTKPYLLRAIHEWCVDNGYTPYISVRVDANTRVPMEHVRNGEIVLNIGPVAAERLRIGNEHIECTVRFSGVARELLIPVAAVASIYARENGHGMSFDARADGGETAEVPASPDTPPGSGGRPALKRIK